MLVRAATVVQVFNFYCMFYFTCDCSLTSVKITHDRLDVGSYRKRRVQAIKLQRLVGLQSRNASSLEVSLISLLRDRRSYVDRLPHALNFLIPTPVLSPVHSNLMRNNVRSPAVEMANSIQSLRDPALRQYSLLIEI